MNLPVNRSAELGVIGACLDGGLETTLEALEMVPSKCFFHDDCRFVYEVIQSDASHGRQTDVIGILDRWKAAYPALLLPPDFYGAQDAHPKWTLQNRAGTVLDLFRRRQAMMAANALLEGAGKLHEPLAEAMSEFEDMLGQSQTNAPPILEGKPLAYQLHDDLQRRHELNGQLSGIDTGFAPLNQLTDGLQAGEIWIIGARPGTGKTAIALNVADHVALTLGVPCLFVSLEMTAVALARRMASMRGSINGTEIRRGSFTESGFKSLTTFNAKLSTSPLKILESPGGIKITQLCHSLRAAIKRWGIKVVFIDYLQKIRPDSKGEKRTYEIGDVSSQLVELIKREKVNLFALAQLNRESEKDKGRSPRLSDLADSKSIEADADLVGLLERPFKNNDTRAMLKIAKQRDGNIGMIPLEFRGHFCRFLVDERKHDDEK